MFAAYSAQQGKAVPRDLDIKLAALDVFLKRAAEPAEAVDRHASTGFTSESRELTIAGLHWLAANWQPDNPLATSNQIWVGKPGSASIHIFSPAPTVPVPPLVRLNTPPGLAPIIEDPFRPVLLVAHYDVHGLSMLALTRRQLIAAGIKHIHCKFNFEETGDISKLWKRTIPRALKSDEQYSAVVMVDLSVHSRKPERTLKAISRLEDASRTRLVFIDHHADTAAMAPELLHPQVELALTDIPSCALIAEYSGDTRELMALGGIGDKQPEMYSAYPPAEYPQLYTANETFHHAMIANSPTPKELKNSGIQPLRLLWEELADGTSLAAAASGLPAPPAPEGLPEHMVCGSVVLVTQKLTSLGRTWYGMLERLMDRTGVPYAVALRILDLERANILFLTNWRTLHTPPIRHFIPEEHSDMCLGHPAAVWLDLHRDQALSVLKRVAAAINEFMGTPSEFTNIGAELSRNIIYPETSGEDTAPEN